MCIQCLSHFSPSPAPSFTPPQLSKILESNPAFGWSVSFDLT
jgi:hypothetical protein